MKKGKNGGCRADFHRPCRFAFAGEKKLRKFGLLRPSRLQKKVEIERGGKKEPFGAVRPAAPVKTSGATEAERTEKRPKNGGIRVDRGGNTEV